ncbi:MAG: hypothetical protein GY861_01010 [bacterium]|nr:hypothetical protein [bacterium]
MGKKIVLDSIYSPINFTDVKVKAIHFDEVGKAHISLYNEATGVALKGSVGGMEIDRIVIDVPAYSASQKETALQYIMDNGLLSQLGLAGTLEDE